MFWINFDCGGRGEVEFAIFKKIYATFFIYSIYIFKYQDNWIIFYFYSIKLQIIIFNRVLFLHKKKNDLRPYTTNYSPVHFSLTLPYNIGNTLRSKIFVVQEEHGSTLVYLVDRSPLYCIIYRSLHVLTLRDSYEISVGLLNQVLSL